MIPAVVTPVEEAEPEPTPQVVEPVNGEPAPQVPDPVNGEPKPQVVEPISEKEAKARGGVFKRMFGYIWNGQEMDY